MIKIRTLHQHKNLIKSIQDVSRENKGITFIDSNDNEVFHPYHSVYDNAKRILFRLQEKGIYPGTEFVFQIDDSYHFICVFWACLMGKYIPVPITVGVNSDHRIKLFNVWKKLNNPHLITTPLIYSELETFAKSLDIDDFFSSISEHTIYLNDLESTVDGNILEINEDDIAFIQFSSGSTGDPKGIVLTHKNLLTNCHAIINALKSPPEGETFFSWMPLTHDMGIIGFHLTPLVANYNQFIMKSKLFIRDPLLWLKKISEHRITFTASPNFGYKYVLKHFKSDKDDIDLSSIRMFANGAEPISPEICRQFNETFARFGLRENSMFPVYGLAEASLAVTFPIPGAKLTAYSLDRNNLKVGDHVIYNPQGISLINVGYPINDCFVRVVDDEKNVLSDSVIGHIQIKGDNVTAGYYNDEASTISLIQDGWLDTGDLGFWDNKSLIVTGRQKDVIFVNGQNYYPHDLEKILEEIESVGLDKVVVCGFHNEVSHSDEIAVFIVYRGKLENFIPIAIDCKNRLNRMTGLIIDTIVPIKHIPKTTSGKVQRYLFVHNLMNNEFQEISDKVNILLDRYKLHNTKKDAPGDEIEKKLLAVFIDTFKNEHICITDKFSEIGGNSLFATRIVNNIAQTFQVELSLVTLFEKQSIRDVAEYIKQLKITNYESIPQSKKKEDYPLSSAQKRLYYLYQLNPTSIAYNIPQFLLLEGEVDVRKLEDSLNRLIERHEILRTSFHTRNNQPCQKIHEEISCHFIIKEIKEDHLQREIERIILPFELSGPPLFRVYLLKISNDKYVFAIDIHHIICDGISLPILISELFLLYNNKKLKQVKIHFRDFVNWQNEQSRLNQLQIQEKFWIQQFDDEIPVLKLPSDYSRPATFSYKGMKIPFEIGEHETKQLKKFATTHETSLQVVIFSLYYILLQKYSSQEDIVVGIPVAGRNHLDLENSIGMFVNNLALRNCINPEKSFLAYLTEIKQTYFKALENQDYLFEDLYNRLASNRDMSRNPLFDVMFVYQNMEMPNTGNTLTYKRYFYDTGISRFDLTLEIFEEIDFLSCYVEFATDLFRETTIRRLINHFKKIVHDVVENPDSKVSKLNILSDGEFRDFILNYNNSHQEYPKDKTVYDLFIEQVRKNPEKIVIKDLKSNLNLDYSELNKKAALFAYQLKKRGISRGSHVAILGACSIDAIVAILATIKAGGTYIPIDYEFPQQRINFILKDCKADVVIIDKNIVCQNFAFISNEYETIYTDININHDRIELDDKADCLPDDLAYIIYTSGTTGNPKGVQVKHQSLMNYAWWAAKTYIKEKQVTIPFYTSISFDLTVTSIFMPLITGNPIIVYKNDERDLAIEKIVDDNQVDIIKLTPSHLKVVFEKLKNSSANEKCRIKRFIVGGELFETSLAQSIYDYFDGNIDIFNEYGPTEATVGCMIHLYSPEIDNAVKSVPIGKPAANTQIYVLDNYFNPQPIGITGEIYISGDGLANGYINNDNPKFMRNPFVDGQRMYKTGDLARRLSNGNLEYLGRNDDQVKIRGYRVELAEISCYLKDFDEIADAIVIIKHDHNNNEYLCTYIVANEISIEEIRKRLTRQVPFYMVPRFFVRLPKIPLNKNGKVDLKALPDPEIDKSEKNQSPGNNKEEILLKVWSEVFDYDKIGINSNFFALGGDSIKAVQISSRLHEYSISANTKDILSYQTIEQLASILDFDENLNLYEQGFISGKKRLTPIESWFFEQKFNSPNHWNQSVLLNLEKKIDLSLLEKAFQLIVNHHDGLRLNYEQTDGCLIFTNELPDQKFRIERYDLSPDSVNDASESIFDKVRSDIDISSGLLIKAAIINFNDKKTQLFITAHHLIIDGVSWRILLNDIYTIYNKLSNGKDAKLANKTASLKDWHNSLQTFSASPGLKGEISFWEKINDTQFSIPCDFSTDDWKTENITRVAEKLSHEQTTLLKTRIHEAYKTDVQIILLTVLGITLKKWSGEDTFIIELENHGRNLNDIDVSRTIGWFTSMYPIKLEIKNDNRHEVILAVKEQVRTVPNYGIGYGVLKYLNKNFINSRFDMSEIRFNYLGEYDKEFNNDLFSYSSDDTGSDVGLDNHMTTKLEINCFIINNRFEMFIQYNQKAHRAETMQWFKDTFFQELDHIIQHLTTSEDLYFTPSDFETLTLKQSELNQLFK